MLREPLRRRPFVIVNEGEETSARGSDGTIACPGNAANRLDEIRQSEPVAESSRNPLARARYIIVDDYDFERRGVSLVD